MGTDIHGVFQEKTESGWKDIPSNYEQDRHYLLFAWIGNVRNGFGFAGCQTHTPITALTDNRGLPDDFICDDDTHPIDTLDVMDNSRREWHAEDEPLEIWMGDHSYSWVSGTEVLAADLPRITRSGIVSKKEYASWDGNSAPESWCGGVSGPGVKVSAPGVIEEDTTHVQIDWAEDTSETLAYFVDEMRRLVKEHGEVRLVFGFDS